MFSEITILECSNVCAYQFMLERSVVEDIDFSSTVLVCSSATVNKTTVTLINSFRLCTPSVNGKMTMADPLLFTVTLVFRESSFLNEVTHPQGKKP